MIHRRLFSGVFNNAGEYGQHTNSFSKCQNGTLNVTLDEMAECLFVRKRAPDKGERQKKWQVGNNNNQNR